MSEVRLFLLRRIDGHDYDQFRGFVIRARTHYQARCLAQEAVLDSYEKPAWMDLKTTACTLLDADGKIGVVLADFVNG